MDRRAYFRAAVKRGTVEHVTTSQSLNLNSTAAALLGLLHDRPQTGGELVAAAEERFGSFWTLTRSQVYRELPALAAAGYVRTGKSGPRGAQPYSITAAGKRAFAAWLATPAGPDHSRNPLLLRLGFGEHHNKTQLKNLIAEAKEEHESRLAAHRAAINELRKGDSSERFRLATAQFGVAYERALLKWLESVPTN